jgi:hypothetical protein
MNMAFGKYKFIMILLLIGLLVLFAIVDYQAYYLIGDNLMFIILESVALLITMVFVLIIWKLDTYVRNEGYQQISEAQLYKLRDHNIKIGKSINNSLKRDFFDT